MTDRRFIVVDLDDTVCQSWRREHLIESGGWDDFHADLVNDEPIADMARLIRLLSWANAYKSGGPDNYEPSPVIALTARPERWRAATLAWLAKHDVPVDIVLMRPIQDYRKSPEVKIALLAEFFGAVEAIKDNVAMVIDDREDVCKAFAGLGVTTLLIYARRDCNAD